MMFYLKAILISSTLIALGLLSFPNYKIEIGIGTLLPWLNSLAGYSYLSKHLYSPDASATYAALINTGFRLVFMLISFTFVIVLLPVNELVFIIALFFSYICNSILETTYLQRLKNQN